MTQSKTLHPIYPLALGALLGGLLLMVVVLDATWASDGGRYLLNGFLFGMPPGALVGGALWVTCTRRQIASLFLLAAWWWLGVMGGLVLAVGVLNLPAMSPHLNPGRDGSGGPGVFLVFLTVVLSAILAGSVVGIGVGIWRLKARNRKYSQLVLNSLSNSN